MTRPADARVPGAAQREAKRNGALQTRDRSDLRRSRISGAPLHFVARCAASGTRGIPRRAVLTLLGAAWPLAARAQQPAMPVIYGALGGKRLELLRELVPAASLIAVLTNPKNPNSEDHLADIEAAARAMGSADPRRSRERRCRHRACLREDGGRAGERAARGG